MPVTPEERERDDLLDRIPAYAREHGLAGLSVERVAAWLGRAPDDLYQFFPTDTDLLTALVARNRVRLRDGFARLDADPSADDRVMRRRMWHAYLEAADDSELFFEAYGLALHDEHYGAFLHGVNDWLELIVESMVRRGVSSAQASAFATLTLAAYRGAMLDYCVTRDRARVSAAMEMWFDIADRIAPRGSTR